MRPERLADLKFGQPTSSYSDDRRFYAKCNCTSVSHDVAVMLSALTLLTVLCAGLTLANGGRCINSLDHAPVLSEYFWKLTGKVNSLQLFLFYLDITFSLIGLCTVCAIRNAYNFTHAILFVLNMSDKSELEC